MEQNAQLNIKSFRSIKSLELSELGQFNLLIEKNKCGKSTLLEAMYLASATPQIPLFAVNATAYNLTFRLLILVVIRILVLH